MLPTRGYLLALGLFSAVWWVRCDYMGRLCGTQFGSGDHGHFYPSGGSTVRKCIEYCNGFNYTYAAMLFGRECFCDNSLNGYHVCTDDDTSSICVTGTCQLATGMPCQADPTMTCGDTLWYSLYDSGDNYNIITHWATLVSEVCSENDPTCSWYCYVTDQEYEYATGAVFGTDVYDIHSSYCLAAAHSLRYEANVKTNVTVDRAEQGQNLTLEGSWRYAIASQWAITKDTFTVTMPDENFDFGSSVLFGFVNLGTRKLSCIRYGGSVEVFAATLNNKVQSTATDLPLLDDQELFCGLKATSGSRYPASYVAVITQPTGNQAVAINRTITINEGDDLEFNFKTSGLSNGPFSVIKQNEVIVAPSNDSQLTVKRSDAKSYFSGFYELYNSQNKWQGSVRAIVVPSGDDLSRCSGFKGFPREDGTCLCVPPFGGDNKCSQVCKKTTLDGSFGPKCDMNCGSDQCKGQLICGEDPFGCHCASGWTGSDCSSECPQDTYGPDCKGHANGCHCLQSSGCSRITGDCPFGCIWGWLGDACTNEAGYIETAPYIITEGHADIQVGWDAWVKGQDKGDVAPNCYWLEYKKLTDPDSDYKNSSSSCFNAGPTTFTTDVTGLDVYTTYAFRVRTVVSNEITPNPSDVVNGTTNCGMPLVAPQKLSASPGVRSIELSWEWPDKQDWRCNQVTIHCDYSCLYRCDSSITPTMSFEMTTKTTDPASYLVVGLPPYATCDFQCYFTLGCGRNGPSVALKNIKDSDGTPTAVLNLEAFSDSAGLLTAWEVPFGEDNHVTSYNVQISDRSGLVVTDSTNETKYEYSGAKSGSLYTVTVRATTKLGEGAASTVYARYFKPVTGWSKQEREIRKRSANAGNEELLNANEKLVDQITQALLEGNICNRKPSDDKHSLETATSDQCKNINQNTYGISMIVLACLCGVFLLAFLSVTFMYFNSTGKGEASVTDTEAD